MQLLYGLDSRGGLPAPGRDLAPDLALLPELEAAARDHAAELVQGVLEHQAGLDRLLDRASTNWRVERMSRVDRNVLRVAALELTEHPDVPRAVVLDEAIEIAKQLGSTESGGFVNGVLNQVLALLG